MYTDNIDKHPLTQLSEELSKEIDKSILSIKLAECTLPNGYRIMNKGEYPNEGKGDLCYSFNTDPKWSKTTMTGKHPIRAVPVEGLLWATRS